MKKILITTIVTVGVAVGAMAQGSINIDSFNTQITTPGANATDPSLATTWYSPSGDLTINASFWYLATGSATQTQINAINAQDGVSGSAAMALLVADGFTEVSDTTPTGSTIGSVNGLVNDGQISFSTGTVGLSGAPSSTTGWLALVAVGGAGAFSGYEGVLVAANGTGGNPNAVPAGTAANGSGIDALNLNLVLTPVPEPATIALASLGGLALLAIRRRKV